MALNQAAINVEVINGYPPAVLYFRNVIASSTTITSFLKRAGAIRSAISTTAASLVRGVRKSITYTSTSTATILKAIIQSARSVTSATTSTIRRQFNRTVNGIVATSTSTVQKAVGKLVTYNEIAVNTISRAVRRTLTVVGTSASNLYKLQPKSYSASSTSTASELLRVNKNIVSSLVVSSVVLTRLLARFVVVSYNSITTSSFVKRVSKLVIDSVAVTVVITDIISLFRTLLITSTSVASIRKVCAKTIIAISSSISNVIKSVLKTFITSGTKTLILSTLNGALINDYALNEGVSTTVDAIGITSTPTISVNSFFYKLLTILSTSVSTIVNVLIRARLLAVNVVSSTTRLVNLFKTFSLLEVFSICSLAPNAIYLFILNITSTISSTLNERVNKVVSATSTSLSSILKAARKNITALSSTVSTLRKQASKLVTALVTSTVTLPAKGIRKVITLVSNTLVTLSRFNFKLLLEVEVGIATIITVANRLVVLLAYSNSNAKITKGFSKTLVALQSIVVALFKQVAKTFIVSGTRTVMTGTLNSSFLNERTLNSDDAVYTESPGISSTATVSVNAFYYRILTILSIVSASLTRTRGTVKVLVANVTTSIVNILKDISTTLYIDISSTVTLVFSFAYLLILDCTSTTSSFITNNIKKLIQYISVTVVLLSRPGQLFRTLLISSTVVASLRKAIPKLFNVVSTTISSLVKKVLLTFITFGNKYVMTGTLGSSVLNGLTINTDDPVYVASPGVSSTATVSVDSLYYKLLTILATSTSSILSAFVLVKLLIANTIISTVSIVKQFSLALYTFVSTVVDTFKEIKLILITYGIKYVMTGGLNGLVLNELSINDEPPPSYIIAEGVSSTTTVSVLSNYYRALNALSSTISSIFALKVIIKLLIANVITSVSSIKKVIDKVFETVSSFVDATLTSLAVIFVVLTTLVTTTSTLLAGQFFFRVLSVISTSTSTISKARVQILATIVNVYLTINTIYGKLLVTVVSSFSRLIANFVYFTELLSKIYIYAEDRVRSLSVEKLRILTEDDRLRFLTIKKLRTVLTEKIRTVFITKDDIV